MLDAYTIKKVMPRLVAAAILIQLSWPLLTTAINVVSQLSWGLEGLIYLPFGGRSALDIGTSLEAAGGNGSFTLLFAGGLAWMGLGAPGLMALAIGVLVALMVAFFTLAIRQILIIMLVLTAPLALVAWILPNTERLWKLWWGLFSKALLMYPLILLLIAGGRIAAHLVAAADLPEVISVILVIVVFFLPFFLIAKTFQYAGGALSATANVINSRGSKVTSGFAKRSNAKQAAKWADRRARADENRLFDPEGKFNKYNDLASSLVNPKAAAQIQAAALAKKTGVNIPGSKSGARILSGIAQSKWDSTEKFAGVLSKSGMNDRALNALTYWDGTQQGVETLAKQLEASGDTNDIMGAQQLRQNAGALYGVYKSEEYGRADVRGSAGLALAAQGFTSGDQIARVANDMDSRSPGMGLGNTFKTSAELAGSRAGALTKPGYTVTYDETADNGKGAWVGADYNEGGAAFKQVSKIGVQDIGASKGLFAKSYVDHETGKKVETKNAVGDAMIKTLQKGGADEQELLGTLVTAYGSYNNPAVRKDVRKVLTEAYAGREGMDVDALLSRATSNPAAEQAQANEGAPEPPAFGEPPS